MAKDDVAIRKRTQIAKANRTMFMWIAAASVVVGASGVAGYFLVQKLVYSEKVLIEKNKTLATLEKNNKAVADLRKSVDVLDTNQALMSIKANDDDRALQVVLDALPADANSLAFGASLQNKLFAGIDGLTIESMSISPTADESATADSEGTGSSAAPSGDGSESGTSSIDFQFMARGNSDALRHLLANLERSIRTIQVLSMDIETQEGVQTLTVSARTFYEPKKTIQLREEEVPR